MVVESNKKDFVILEIKNIVVALIIDWQHKIKKQFYNGCINKFKKL